jgi:hypothetical protein
LAARPKTTTSVVAASGWVVVPDFSQYFATKFVIRARLWSLGGLFMSPPIAQPGDLERAG